ncbi:MAG: APC family permease [Thermoprotei archaeon]
MTNKPGVPSKVFAREATGLVKEVSGWASFMATWFLVTGGVPIFIISYYYVYQGADFLLAFLLALLPTLALAGLYTVFSISMPRSGGDYVFVSRGLHPFLGFVNSFSLAVAFLISQGVYAAFEGYYIGYQLYTQGILSSSTQLQALASSIETPVHLFIITMVILLFIVAMAVLRPKYTWGAMYWIGIGALVLTVIMFVALGSINAHTFATKYDSFVSTYNTTLTSQGYANITTYQQTIVAGGWSPPKSVLLATLAAFPLAWYSYTWYTLPSTWAGEMKQAKKSVPIAILGGTLWVAVYYLLFLFFVNHAFGQPFLTSWSELSTNSSYGLPYTISTYIPFFIQVVYGIPLLSILVLLALFIPNLMAGPAVIIGATRYIFAWSFDRILPERISSVSERLHTPLVATLISFAVATFGAALEIFAPQATPGVLVPIFTFGYILPALSGLLFPYVRKEMYEAVFVVKRRILKVPAVTWLGGVSLISLIIGTYSLKVGGFMNFVLPDYLFYGLAYGVGIVIFVASYYYRKRQGVDLTLAFKEIPPE